MMLVQSLCAGSAGLANIAPSCIARRLSSDSRGARLMRPLVNRLLPDALIIA